MTDFISALEKWQSLVGAIVSATAAFSVAFLLAYINRRREDVSAAMVLVGNLTTVMSANETLRTLAAKERVPDDDYPRWLVARLSSSRPTLSPLFEGCVAKLMPVDTTLAAHLELFGAHYRSVERHLDRIIEDDEYFRQHQKILRSIEDTKIQYEVVKTGFSLAAKHGECAEGLLTLFVLSNWPTLHRLRRLVRSTKGEKECSKLLKTGVL